MEFFGFIFGLFELAFIAVFTIALVIGCTFDRSYDKASVKWYTVLIAAVILAIWHWGDLSFGGIWATATSFEFWKPALVYLGIGFLYCLPEFYLGVRKIAKEQEASWSDFITGKARDAKGNFTGQLRAELFAEAKVQGLKVSGEHEHDSVGVVAIKNLDDYLTSRARNSYSLVNFKLTDDFSISPVVNRAYLASCVGAWTIFWPFYLVSLVIGDLLSEIFSRFADLIASLSGRWVKLIFRDTFKI